MIKFNLESFKNIFNVAAKSYLFYYSPVFPFRGNSENLTYLVKSSSLPSSSFEESITSMQNMDFKTAGKRSFENWTATFHVDNKAVIRKAFSQWMELIHNPVSNIHQYPAAYMKDQSIKLISPVDKQEIMTYNLIKAWPSQLGEVALDYSNSDYAQFDVVFTYQYYTTK